jgi:transposase-like protein
VPKQSMMEAVAADLRSIFHAEDLATAQTKLAAVIEKYSRSAPQLATWM